MSCIDFSTIIRMSNKKLCEMISFINIISSKEVRLNGVISKLLISNSYLTRDPDELKVLHNAEEGRFSTANFSLKINHFNIYS